MNITEGMKDNPRGFRRRRNNRCTGTLERRVIDSSRHNSGKYLSAHSNRSSCARILCKCRWYRRSRYRSCKSVKRFGASRYMSGNFNHQCRQNSAAGIARNPQHPCQRSRWDMCTVVGLIACSLLRKCHSCSMKLNTSHTSLHIISSCRWSKRSHLRMRTEHLGFCSLQSIPGSFLNLDRLHSELGIDHSWQCLPRWSSRLRKCSAVDWRCG